MVCLIAGEVQQRAEGGGWGSRAYGTNDFYKIKRRSLSLVGFLLRIVHVFALVEDPPSA